MLRSFLGEIGPNLSLSFRGELTMDAKEFFSVVVVENYKEAIADPANLRKLWNAAVSMNTVAEYLAPSSGWLSHT
jgi:hypothetical protein